MNDTYMNDLYDIDDNGCWNWRGIFVKTTPMYSDPDRMLHYYSARRLMWVHYKKHYEEPYRILLNCPNNNQSCVNPDHARLVITGKKVSSGLCSRCMLPGFICEAIKKNSGYSDCLDPVFMI